VRILFVEDHAGFAKIAISTFLAEHEVTIAPSLESARAAVASAEFDVLLVDYDLPDGKGERLVLEVRRAGNPVRIVAVSAHEMGNQALLDAGADAVCRKADFPKIATALT